MVLEVVVERKDGEEGRMAEKTILRKRIQAQKIGILNRVHARCVRIALEGLWGYWLTYRKISEISEMRWGTSVRCAHPNSYIRQPSSVGREPVIPVRSQLSHGCAKDVHGVMGTRSR